VPRPARTHAVGARRGSIDVIADCGVFLCGDLTKLCCSMQCFPRDYSGLGSSMSLRWQYPPENRRKREMKERTRSRHFWHERFGFTCVTLRIHEVDVRTRTISLFRHEIYRSIDLTSLKSIRAFVNARVRGVSSPSDERTPRQSNFSRITKRYMRRPRKTRFCLNSKSTLTKSFTSK